MIKTSKIFYLIKSALNYFQEEQCPYCKEKGVKTVDRKYLFTTLKHCNRCNLMFRHPQDNVNDNFNFYKHNYQQEGITTDLPDHLALQNLINTKFKNTIRSIETSALILKTLVKDIANQTILDYGCSWGYTTWQFQDIGMKAYGYEISKKRAEYGSQNLGISIVSDLAELNVDKFDFIYSSHVIEHLADLNAFVNYCLKKVKTDGYIILLCPNGSNDFKTANPKNFHSFWGEVHPNLISDDFLKYVFNGLPLFISSSTYNQQEIRNWDQKSQKIVLNGGNELLCIIKNSDLTASA